MILQSDTARLVKGTRFKLFAQTPALAAFRQPETVWVSPPPGRIQPGPADDRMYVVDPRDAKKPYDYPVLPPYRGPCHPPVKPDTQGHFDYLDDPASREFRAAHLYGTLRWVLDIWERYWGGCIHWHCRQDYPRLELIPQLDWNNAQAGYGFLETGYGSDASGAKQPYCLNFDVLAHELGHIMLYAQVGIPSDTTVTAAFRGFHESAADLTALISVLHFESFIQHLLSQTHGNLYALNELNRIGELSETRQIRLASNADKLSDVPPINTPLRYLSHAEQHQLAQPMTGAIFDILVEVFQQNLLSAGLISRSLADLSSRVVDQPVTSTEIEAGFQSAYADNPAGFRAALVEARDFVGLRLARTWRQLSPHYLSYTGVAATFLSVDRRLSGWKYQNSLCGCFTWREIGNAFTFRR